MIKLKYVALFILFTGLLFSCKNTLKNVSPGSIEGSVYDAAAGSGLAKAKVVTNPPTSSVTTDSLGTYKIENVASGVYHVNASKLGYDSSGVNITVSDGQATTADIPLLSDTLSSK